MQIVIDIPEEEYQNYLKMRPSYPEGVFCYIKAIQNGKPLPEHHGRLIDEQDISPLYHCMSHIYCEHRDCNTCQFCCVTKYEVTDAPTIIKAEGSDAE